MRESLRAGRRFLMKKTTNDRAPFLQVMRSVNRISGGFPKCGTPKWSTDRPWRGEESHGGFWGFGVLRNSRNSHFVSIKLFGEVLVNQSRIDLDFLSTCWPTVDWYGFSTCHLDLNVANLWYPANNEILSWLVDHPTDTKRLFWLSFYPSKIDLLHPTGHVADFQVSGSPARGISSLRCSSRIGSVMA